MGSEHHGSTSKVPEERRLRADARRNRERVLQVAQEVFAAEGLSVPVHEIARRAGVGTGTVSRHFPTKQALFEAILRERMRQYVQRAEESAAGGDAGAAFFDFFAFMVREGAVDRGLADALSGTDFGKGALAADPAYNVAGAVGRLLAGAQRAGAVRGDVEVEDVLALMVGCLHRTPAPGGDTSAQQRLIDIASTGMRAAAPN